MRASVHVVAWPNDAIHWRLAHECRFNSTALDIKTAAETAARRDFARTCVSSSDSRNLIPTVNKLKEIVGRLHIRSLHASACDFNWAVPTLSVPGSMVSANAATVDFPSSDFEHLEFNNIQLNR